MGSKYTSQAVSAYNSAPPSDDGAQTDANKIRWSAIKQKLGDPLNTAVAAINTALLAFLDFSVNQVSGNYTTVAGDHMRTVEVAPSVSSAVTISLGDAATMTANYVVRVKNSGSSTVTITRATLANTIDGITGNTVLAPAQSYWFSTNPGADGYVIAGGYNNSYEEGVWTPSEATIGALAVAVGTYEKIGRQVTARAHMQWPNTADTTFVVINGLPYTVANGNSAQQAFITFTSIPANAGFLLPVTNSTQTQVYKSDGVTRANNANLDLQTIYATWIYNV
jgi:hypothetical protein